MPFNSSSPFNSSLNSPVYSCSKSIGSTLVHAAYNVTKTILLLPLCILVLYLGFQRWRQQRSFSKTSHSDIFTYHIAAIELIWVLGSALFFYGFSAAIPEIVVVGVWLLSLTYYGENFCHLLTCVERYLAVVYPITYLGLRNARGIRIRNISILCVWLLSFVLGGVVTLHHPTLPLIKFFGPLVPALLIISFCSLSVLHVLIRPGPGDEGQDRERVNQSKKRAFFTIMTIMAVLWLWFGALIVSYSLYNSPLLSPSTSCVLKASAFWFSLPSSLVLPLLYLHRACCCYNSR